MQDSPKPNTIFILAGQSNMSGRGGVIRSHTGKHWDGITPPECNPNACILRMNASFSWEQAHEPLHVDIDTKKTCGVGPGMAFANAVLEKGGCGVIGLVPCAVGGTAIREWMRGEVLYESMVKRGRECCSGGGVVKCLLWYQGESDTLGDEDAARYRGKMERFVKDVREDLGLPDLPIIQVALASGDKRYIETVRKAQLEMDIPNVVCVDAKGLPLQEDHLHLTTEAQVKLGHMLAEAYRNHFAPK